MTERTDFVLLNGDSDAFTELYDRYSVGIRAFMFKYRLVNNSADLEDILQLIWVRVNLSKSKYNPQWAFSTWLSKVALSTTLSFYRDQERTLPAITNQNLDSVLEHRHYRDPLVVAETVMKVRKAVEELPENAREAVEKLYFLSTSVITRDCRPGYRRARRLLKGELRKLNDELSTA